MRSAIFPVVLAVAIAGCSVGHQVTGPPPGPSAPVANSPTKAIRLFEWGWDHRDLATFENLLTDDFRFVFALADSAGNLFPDHGMDRWPLLFCLQHLFTGGGLASPATSISLVLDPRLIALPDSRAGRNPRWHKEILTSVDLTIKTEDLTEYAVTGHARFFVVRGDSAILPAELGVGPDSTRWYIQQWNDETLRDAIAAAPDPAGSANLLAPQPAHQVTWGRILAYYYWGPRR